MSSSDYQSLTRRQVDVKSSFSFDTAFSYGFSVEESDPFAKEKKSNAEWSDKVDMEYMKVTLMLTA